MSEPRALKACDACKRRKVRCDGRQDCAQCSHLNLSCRYSAPNPSSRVRKNIVRGGVIHEIKGEPSSVSGLPTAIACKPILSSSSSSAMSDSPQSNQSPAYQSQDYFTTLAMEYLTRCFPFLPVVSATEVFTAIESMNTSRECQAFIHALGAVTMNMTRVGPRHPAENVQKVMLLCTRSLEFRGVVMPDSPITLHSVLVPLFICTCLLGKRRNGDMAFYYMREAISRLNILQHNGLGEMDTSTLTERAQQHRLYWLLFIHERFLAISHNRTIVLPALPDMPSADASIDPKVTEGFNRIISLFLVIDEEFIKHWLDRESTSMTYAWIEAKQLQLGTDMDGWEGGITHLDALQQIDLVVTRYWLHTLIWQMALTKFLLTSVAAVESGAQFMSIMFPIQLAHRLRTIVAYMPDEAIEVHGTGFVHKVFDITSTIADILIHVPDATRDHDRARAHLHDFMFLHAFLLDMSPHYLVEEQVLIAKFEVLQTLYPQFCNVNAPTY